MLSNSKKRKKRNALFSKAPEDVAREKRNQEEVYTIPVGPDQGQETKRSFEEDCLEHIPLTSSEALPIPSNSKQNGQSEQKYVEDQTSISPRTFKYMVEEAKSVEGLKNIIDDSSPENFMKSIQPLVNQLFPQDKK